MLLTHSPFQASCSWLMDLRIPIQQPPYLEGWVLCNTMGFWWRKVSTETTPLVKKRWVKSTIWPGWKSLSCRCISDWRPHHDFLLELPLMWRSEGMEMSTMSFFRKPPVFSRDMEVKTQLEVEAAKSRRFFFRFQVHRASKLFFD